MTRFLLLALLVLAADVSHAQVGLDGTPTQLYMGSQRPPVTVTVTGVVQSYSDDEAGEFLQISTPVTVFAPLTRNVGASLRTGYVSVSGDGALGNELASVSGLTDTQAIVSVAQRLGQGSAVANVSVNLPTGSVDLSPEESEAAFLFGQSFYGFRTPSAGQGFNAAGGVTYAVPAGDALTIGLGVAYQARGNYSPRLGSGEYDPADDLLMTGGLDYGFGPGRSVSLDLTYAMYGSDVWEGTSYETGDAVTVTGRIATLLGDNAAWLMARFRSKGETAAPPTVQVGPDSVVPTQARGLGHVQFAFGERVEVGTFAQVRHYAASERFGARTLFDLGLAPAFEVSPGLQFVTRVGLTFGDLSGFEVGGGLRWVR